MPETEDQRLGSVYKEPIIYGEAGLKIILISYAESWGGTGGPKKGWLIWPEKGDFERCLGKVELCQIRRLYAPVFERMGQAIVKVEWF